MDKKKLKYYIEFSEIIEDPEDIEPDELERISKQIKNHLYEYLTRSGLQVVDQEIKLDFDLE